MKMSTKFEISGFFWTILALYNRNVAAAYVSVSAHVILFMLHAIEVKLNKLLDQHGLRVGDDEIDR